MCEQAEKPEDVAVAFRWLSDGTPEEVMSEREHIMSSLEAAVRSTRASGACEMWLRSADAALAAVSSMANGPVLTDSCRTTGYVTVMTALSALMYSMLVRSHCGFLRQNAGNRCRTAEA